LNDELKEEFIRMAEEEARMSTVGPIVWLDSDGGAYPEKVLDAMRATMRELSYRGSLPSGFATEANLQDVVKDPAQLTAFVWLLHCCEQALERTVRERNELRQQLEEIRTIAGRE